MDWISFLSSNGIAYVTRGPNTKRGEISVKCPWCGDEDPSEHLGINPITSVWGCLRDPTHRGQSPLYLIANLLNCSQREAQLTLNAFSRADPDNFENVIKNLKFVMPQEILKPEPLRMSPDFRRITKEGSSRRFFNYLLNRGFDNPLELAYRYNLRYCVSGKFKDRIIFPVVQKGKLIAWTGRAIGKTVSAPRYLSTGSAIKSAIFNEDEIYLGGRTLIITEGPFDAVKLDMYAPNKHDRATCIFGTSLTIEQIYILKRVSAKYKKTVVMLDNDAIQTSWSVSEWIPQAEVYAVPGGNKDPGAMNSENVRALMSRIENDTLAS